MECRHKVKKEKESTSWYNSTRQILYILGVYASGLWRERERE
jgi:hypothetical protein